MKISLYILRVGIPKTPKNFSNFLKAYTLNYDASEVYYT